MQRMTQAQRLMIQALMALGKQMSDEFDAEKFRRECEWQLAKERDRGRQHELHTALRANGVAS